MVNMVQRDKLQGHGHLWTCFKNKDDHDWVKRCVTLEAEGARLR